MNSGAARNFLIFPYSSVDCGPSTKLNIPPSSAHYYCPFMYIPIGFCVNVCTRTTFHPLPPSPLRWLLLLLFHRVVEIVLAATYNDDSGNDDGDD